MGRPKKKDGNQTSTRDRIIETAIELFAKQGYDAISIRDITRTVGLNEASLYNHFQGKADLLGAIFQRLEAMLINPGFNVPPQQFFTEAKEFDLASFLCEGARRFFGHADKYVLYTWQLLMSNQYFHEAARKGVREHLLNAPLRFFTAILQRVQAAGKISGNVDCDSGGRIIAAVFFDYSFRTILDAAWKTEEEADDDEAAFCRLEKDIRQLCRSFSE